MTLDITIAASLGIISAIFAYYAFQLRESGEELTQKIALFLFAMSISFVNLLMYSLYLMVNNDPSYSYLKSTVMDTGLLIMVGLNMVFVTIIVAVLLYLVIMWLYQTIKNALQTSKRYEDE